MKVLIVFLFFISSQCFGQYTVQWQKTYGGTNDETALSMVLLPSHQLVICGTAESNNGDISNSWGAQDVWLLGVDSSGNKLWDRSYGSFNGIEKGQAICSDSTGGLVFAGYASDNGNQVNGLHGSLGFDWWVGGVDSLHNLTWQRCLGGTSNEYNVRSLERTSSGKYLLAGEAESTDGDVVGNSGGQCGWMVLYDTNTGIEFQNVSNALQLSHYNFAKKSLGNGYYSNGYAWIFPNCNIGNSDINFRKYDSNGVKTWEFCFGGTDNDYGTDFIENSDGTVWILGGVFSNDVDVSGNHGFSDTWLALVDTFGNVLKQNCFGGMATDAIQKIIKCSDGGLLMVGSTNSSQLNGQFNNIHGLSDALIIKTDNRGDFVWGQCFGGSGNDDAYSVIENTDGSLYVLCTTTSTDGDVTSNHGMEDYWLLKLVPNSVSIPETESAAGNLSLRVNCESKNILVLYSSQSASDVNMTIYDITGKKLLSTSTKSRIGMNNFEINNFNSPSGIYILEMNTGKISQKAKFAFIY